MQALFCQVPPHHVLTLHDVSNIWQVRGGATSPSCPNAPCKCLACMVLKPHSLHGLRNQSFAKQSFALQDILMRCEHLAFSMLDAGAQVPLVMADQRAHETICEHLHMTNAGPLNLTEWKTNLANRWDGLTEVPAVLCRAAAAVLWLATRPLVKHWLFLVCC